MPVFWTVYTINILGYIEFEDKYDAEDAIKDLDDTKLGGERVKPQLSKVWFRFFWLIAWVIGVIWVYKSFGFTLNQLELEEELELSVLSGVYQVVYQ